MSLLAQLLLNVGVDATASRASVAGKFFAEQPVMYGPEFERICRLPRRQWSATDELVDLLSAHLRRPGSSARLWPWQAVALQEAHDHGRLCVVANVGTGKTLVSAVLPTLLDERRVLLLTYARLVDKSIKEFRELGRDWRVYDSFEFMSVESLSLAKNADYLWRFQPTMIINDESHAVKSISAGRTKRLDKYLRDFPTCKYVPLTGTPGDDSLHNQAHIQEWVHADQSPLPRSAHELVQWSQAVDSQVERRREPGTLTVFSGGLETLDAVRDGLGRRISETPGNVYYRRPSEVSCSLYLSARVLKDLPELVENNYQHAKKHVCAPDGRAFREVQLHLALQTLPLGFWHLLDPVPPEPWAAARREWGAFVRDHLSQTAATVETPKQVADLCESGVLDSGGIYETWRDLQPSFKPNSITEWFDDSALRDCADWLSDEPRGLVWTPYPAFGRKLAELTGRPFFHAQGLDLVAGSIEHYVGGPAIVSTQANSEGRNLQDRWSKNLVVSPSARADRLEQQIGRTHRYGQTAESVDVVFYLASRENLEALRKARERAELDRTLNRNDSGKLLLGDWLLPGFADLPKGSFRWKA